MMQFPLPGCAPEVDWEKPKIKDLPTWEDAGVVGLDIETCDPQLTRLGPGPRRGAYIVGVSFRIEDDDRSYYLPIAHDGGGNVCRERALDYLRDQAKVFRGELVGHNLSYDEDFLHYVGVDFDPHKVTRHDTCVVDPLCNELHMKYSLDDVAGRRGLPLKDEGGLRDACSAFGIGDVKGELYKLPAKYVGRYAEFDAEIPLLVRQSQLDEIERKGLWKVHRLEQRVYVALLDMQWRGVAVSERRLERLTQWALDQEQMALDELRVRSGYRIEVGDCTKASVIMPLVQSFGVQWEFTSPKKGATDEQIKRFAPKPQIDRAYLRRVGTPEAESLQRARDVFKLRTTFLDGIRKHLTNGRIHCSFVQMRRDKDDGTGASGTISGRLAGKNPNLQNQPARDPEIGPLLRALYVPDGDGLWCANDFSQQEPRGVVHYAEKLGLSGADKAGHQYRTDPTTDNHSLMKEIIWEVMGEGSITRKQAKIIFLAKCYGMGDGKLCASLGLPTVTEDVEWGGVKRTVERAGDEGRKIIAAFDRAVPFVKNLARSVEAVAKRRGYIRTLGGRRMNFPRNSDGRGFNWTYKALNRLIQGSAADQTKEALAQCFEAGFGTQLQVHDELDLTVSGEKEALEHADVMRNSMRMTVPAKVDTEIGESWGDSMLDSDRREWLKDFYR